MDNDKEYFTSTVVTAHMFENNPNDKWWETSNLDAATDVEVTPPFSKPKRQHTNGFALELPPELGLGSEVEMAKVIAHRATLKYGKLIYADAAFWVFRDTMWHQIPDEVMRRSVHMLDGTPVGKNIIKLKSGAVSGIIKECVAVCSDPQFFAMPALGLNALNGSVVISEKGVATLKDHDPDDKHRFIIAAEYNPKSSDNVPEGSYLHMLLEGVFRGSPDADAKIDLIGEILGAAAYGMATRVAQPKGFIFYGDSANNGKSTIAGLIELLLPEDAVSHIPLNAFGDEKRIIHLAGKAANIVEELSTNSIAGEVYKAAVTGQKIDGRDLYKSAMTFRPRAIHVATTNVLPTFSGGIDRGLQRRLFVLGFDRVIPDEDIVPDILERIQRDEMHLLVAYAISGAKRLVVNRAYTVPKSSHNALNDWLLKDPVLAWFKEKYELVDDVKGTPWTPGKELYKEFELWCQSEGIKEKFVTSREVFSMKFSRIKGVQKHRISSGTQFRGFTYRSQYEDDEFEKLPE